MSSCVNGEVIQETTKTLKNLHLKQDTDDVHNFFDTASVSSQKEIQLSSAIKPAAVPDSVKHTNKRVLLNISPRTKTRANEGTIKELMNCIAYQKDTSVLKDDRTSSDVLSSDSSSEITDVTPLSSSSGCSSLSSGSSATKNSCSECSHSDSEKGQSSDKHSTPSLKFLKEIIDSTNPPKMTRSSVTTANKKKPVMWPNKTFSREQLRNIERQNHILLRKIEQNLNRPTKCQSTSLPSRQRIASSAVNRKKNQKKIDHDNLMLLRKIESVKSTVSKRAGTRRI